MSRNDSKKKELKEKLENEFEELVKKYLPLSSSMNNLCSYLGLRGVDGYYNKIRKIISKYNLSTEHFDSYSQNYEKFLKRKIGKNGKFLPMTDEEFFQSGHNRASDSIIKRLIKGKHKEYKCENCGISKWNGKELRLQVHHINGDHSDNRVENLQLLCPNCHTQTDTYARQNAFKTKGFKITKRLKECLNGEENSFNELNADTLKKTFYQKEKRYCQHCGNEIKGDGKKYCSTKCSELAHRKYEVTKEQLIKDFKELKSFTAVGKKYNVSDNAIRKRSKILGIHDEVRKYITSR